MGVDRGPTALMSPTFFRKARTFAGFWALKQIRALKKNILFAFFLYISKDPGWKNFKENVNHPTKL